MVTICSSLADLRQALEQEKPSVDLGVSIDCWSQLPSATHLRTLDISHAKISVNGIQQLCQWILRSANVFHLKASKTNLSDDLATEVAGMLSDSRTRLVFVELKDNNFTQKGFEAIAQALRTNRTIQSIDLRGSHPSDVTGQLFCASLQSNKTITSLRLDYSSIDFFQN